ncbi:MAG: DUF1015 domain-containing protein [Lachnospiraceae bacterium]
MSTNKKMIFTSADIMLPKQGIDMSKWSVVACDQYTSERAYWEAVEREVGEERSTLKLVFPEIYLEDEGFEQRIHGISNTMKQYLADDIFDTFHNCFIYVKRELANKQVRHGIMGKIDLESYDYLNGGKLPIRATEGTVLERIPPRVRVREKCQLELPHVMLLIDDETCSIIETIANKKENLEKVYDFTLMQESGSMQGYLLDDACVQILQDGLANLMDQDAFCAKYDTDCEDVLVFAVGDGNHSLATAKKCYEDLKAQIGEKALESKARYALVELVNLHDQSLEFEAIHRVVFDVDTQHMKEELNKQFHLNSSNTLEENDFVMIINDVREGFVIEHPESNLAVGDLQKFIDHYMKTYGGRVDYIHGEDVTQKLCEEDDQAVGFLLSCMDKSELYKTVLTDGSLPRKTFSMGEACDKRFYLETRLVKGI